MDLVQLLNDLVANIAALQAQLTDAQASAQALADAKYKEGFDAGVASVVPPSTDKIYSQAELDEAIAMALVPVNQQIAGLQAQIDNFQAQLEQEKQAAVVAFKADLLAKYQAAQSAETEIEKSIEDLLK